MQQLIQQQCYLANESAVELHLFGRWLSESPIIRTDLALRVNLSRILQNELALKLPIICSSTVQYYGFCNFTSGVVGRFTRRYILYLATAELQIAYVAYFQRKIQLFGFSAYPDGLPSQFNPDKWSYTYIIVIIIIIMTQWFSWLSENTGH